MFDIEDEIVNDENGEYILSASSTEYGNIVVTGKTLSELEMKSKEAKFLGEFVTRLYKLINTSSIE